MYFYIMMNVEREIVFRTARSGGAGGQNVNKVETMVEGSFHILSSALLTTEQKELVLEQLSSKINKDGHLKVRNQTERTQLGNKEKVIFKINTLLNRALIKPNQRKPTKPTLASEIKRIKSKKEKSALKAGRKKIRTTDE